MAIKKAIKDLAVLLRSMQPVLDPQAYVFCCIASDLNDVLSLKPIATFHEKEGLTLVITQETANLENLVYDGVFCKITLSVYSSLAAVGLTAAVAGALAAHGISANVMAAFHHDHVFVPQADAQQALAILNTLSA
ncbi:ACT domain-containing protein [Algibacillus agarilyticus]|uniref:ACT domain-containing protein n=1 Tax=Algibacillus agarilyticus TaxID=2234133 RepID=UPI0022B83EE1|nr:ACT domain-containing protein [Algibacillus agarilyticus]